MAGKEQTETTKLFLPFVVASGNRKEPVLLPDEMEKAAVFCLAEMDRAKGGGLILKQPAEELVFLSEIWYPVWLAQWSELDLVFDGMNMISHSLEYELLPDQETFRQNTERSSKTLETYTAFLSDNVNYFRAPIGMKEGLVGGLVTDPDFLAQFTPYIQEATSAETASSGIVTLLPKTDLSKIRSMKQQLENLKSSWEGETRALYESMKLLDATTRNFVKTARMRIRAIRKEYGAKIQEQQRVVAPKIDRLNDGHDEKTASLARDFEKQLLPMEKERVRLEKARGQALQKIERYKSEAAGRKASKDAVGERRWKEKADEAKKELSNIQNELKELDKRNRELEGNRTEETFRLKSEWEAQSKEIKKDLLELEVSRDAEIQLQRQQIEKLENPTMTIVNLISKMAKAREDDLSRLSKLGIPKIRGDSLIHFPFYLTCYQSEKRRRYTAFAPSVANSVSLITKLRGALGGARIKRLLTPRFEALSTFMNKFPSFIEQDALFERNLVETCIRANLLNTEDKREKLREGMSQLKRDGWLSEKEHSDLILQIDNRCG